MLGVGDVLEWIGIIGCGIGLTFLLVREKRQKRALAILHERIALLSRATRELRADAIHDATEIDDPDKTLTMTRDELEEAARKGKKSVPP